MTENHNSGHLQDNGSKKVNRRAKPPELNQEINVGRELRSLCAQRGLSIRALAEKSGLAVNTLSLIQNGKTSPSVSTLQQLALALEVPITAFFKNDFPQSRVAYIKAGQYPGAAIAHGTLEDLGGGLKDTSIEPFIVSIKPNSNSGTHPIVHTGHEFMFCLEGRIVYIIENQTYLLEPGDSLLFESHLPHSWQNVEEVSARAILVLCPLDYRDNPTQLHFLQDDLQKL